MSDHHCDHGQVIEAILERELRIFARRSRPGFLVRALSALSRRPRIDSMIIAQRRAADPESVLCVGDAIQAWMLDASGLKEIPTDQEITGARTGRHWHRQLVNFFVSDDGRTVILNEMEGPKDGMLLSTTVAQQGGKYKLKVKRGRVVLNGGVMG